MMERDFTFKKYRKLCATIVESEYTPLRIRDYLSKKGENPVIIRHDVDRMPKNALTMAEMEQEYGICSTYYFRINREVFIPEIIKKIAGFGHEIGYHYEVLDKTHGNLNKAIEIFGQELKELRKISKVETICMHGNPLTPWSNKDLWKEFDFKEFGVIGEPYLSIDYNELLYLSDTGRTWNGKYSVKDAIIGNSSKFKTTEDVIWAFRNKEISKACLLVHPNRWNDNSSTWLRELVGQHIKNLGKAGIIFYRNFINSSKN